MLSSQGRPWQSMLEPSQAKAAVAIAREVASRLQDRDRVEVAVVAATQQTAYPKSVHWQPYGVAQGYAGLAIMCGYLDACFPDEDWDIIGHRYLELAARDAEQLFYLHAGLFAGLSGLAFATWYLSQDGKRYRKLLAAVEEALLPQAIELANRLAAQKKDVSVGQFDLISGLSGVGAYLLCRKEDPQVAATLRAVLQGLVEMTKEEAGLPCWYTPASLLWEEMLRLTPHGNLNCGLAHGIPGPLGLLSLARHSGIEVDGMGDAIDRAASWLLQHRQDDTWGVNWPTAVPLEADGSVASTNTPPEASSALAPSRTAWCYGSPGIARALWFAGEALDNPEYRELAVDAMEAVYRRPLDVRRIDSPTFCHGVAGLLQITLRFAYDTGLPQYTEGAHALSEQLLSLYNSDSLLGYYSLEPGGNRVDQPGLLDGVPGVVLVLLAAATAVEPTWDRLFLLS
jgi:lantibiotic biosynthesis protein